MLHIIDDEEVIRDSLMWLAKSRGITALPHESGKAFLSMLDNMARTGPQGHAILLDVRMPDLSGIALFDILATRGLTQTFPIIFLTGHGDVPMAVDALKRGAFDFFEKPFNDNKLMDRVQEALIASEQAIESAAIHTRLAALSSREREVLDLILECKKYECIADKISDS